MFSLSKLFRETRVLLQLEYLERKLESLRETKNRDPQGARFFVCDAVPDFLRLYVAVSPLLK